MISTTEGKTVNNDMAFLLCSLQSLLLFDTGQQRYTVISAMKASVTTLSVNMWQKCNSCKWGARMVAARGAKSPSNPCICQQTSHSSLPYGWHWNIFALWDARPFWWESEQTCPSPLWARCKAKAERCMTKGGETSKSEKVKKRRENTETVCCVSPVLQVPEIHQFWSADTKETAINCSQYKY